MNPQELAPDKFQRYQQAHHIISAFDTFSNNSIILDIGASENILELFFTQNTVYQLDICFTHNDRNNIYGDARRLPFKEHSIDFITVLDVIEHVSKQNRLLLIQEIARVVKQAAVFSFPINSYQNNSAECFLYDLEKKILGYTDHFLQEHQKHGLPEENEIFSMIKPLFKHIVRYENFNHNLWFISKIIDIVLSILPDSEGIKRDIFTLFNNSLYLKSMDEPIYRITYVCSHEEIPIHQFKHPEPINIRELFSSLEKSIKNSHSKLKSLDLYSQNLESNIRNLEEKYHALESSYLNIEKENSHLKQIINNLGNESLSIQRILQDKDTTILKQKGEYTSLEKKYLELLQKYLHSQNELKKQKEMHNVYFHKTIKILEDIKLLRNTLQSYKLKLDDYSCKFNEVQNILLSLITRMNQDIFK